MKERKPLADKLSYKEKLDHEFILYAIVESYGDIEWNLWESADQVARQSICWGLRHQYTFLMTSSGILHCESIYHGDVSDHLGFYA